MEQVWIVAGVCVLIGGGIGWLVARFLSRTLLRALWLGLAITFVWILWPAIEINLGWREASGALMITAAGFVEVLGHHPSHEG